MTQKLSGSLAQHITIAIVTWNRTEEVTRLIRSIRANSHIPSDLKLVVLDNGSDDPFYPPDRDEFLTVHRSEINLGCAKGRNFLASKVTSDYILFLDDDATLSDETDLDCAVALFSSDFALGCVSGLVREQRRGRIKIIHPWRMAPARLASLAYSNAPGFLGGCVLLRADAFSSCGGYPTQSLYGGEEFVLATRMAQKGWHFGFTNTLVMDHYPSPNGRHDEKMWAYENFCVRYLAACSLFAYPMRMSLCMFAVLSLFWRLRLRVSLKTVYRMLDGLELDNLTSRTDATLVRFYHVRTLKTLGLRAWF